MKGRKRAKKEERDKIDIRNRTGCGVAVVRVKVGRAEKQRARRSEDQGSRVGRATWSDYKQLSVLVERPGRLVTEVDMKNLEKKSL